MPEAPARSSAERRCRLLLFAYPAQYRAVRGDEIVATMLDAIPAGGRPTLADELDVVAAGLRRRLGTARIDGLDGGLRQAAPVALTLAAGISAFAWWRVEPVSFGSYMGGAALFGVFRTLGPIAYACWLMAALGWAVLRPAAARALIGFAIAATLALPVVAQLTTVDRPPLWVVMALSAFGALALLGTAPAVGATRPGLDERLAVVTGAVAVAVGGWAVTVAWPPDPGTVRYYYQPTLARVSVVVTATVAAVAIVGIRERDRRQWLWATALLGLPAGWIGPFDTTALLQTAPRFGRLAQVVLATCVAVVALAWLSRRTAARLRAAGTFALGTAVGLASFALLARAGHLGFAPGAVPTYVWCGIAALALTGVLAEGVHSGLFGWAAGAFAASFVVSMYDMNWSLAGWSVPGPSLNLVMALALPPLSACAAAAAVALRPGTRRAAVSRRAVAVLAVSLGWIGYVAVPYVRSWGPVILVLAACGLALHQSSRSGLGRTGHERG
ncbi:MAG TPA: hypothetical protein VH561_01845 [Micromonosporaceae bacterium]|jgi:hypothetical protein